MIVLSLYRLVFLNLMESGGSNLDSKLYRGQMYHRGSKKKINPLGLIQKLRKVEMGLCNFQT